MSFQAALETARRNPGDAEAIEELARCALDAAEESKALPFVSAAAARLGNNARLWQWLGLLHRSLDDRAAAIPAFETAARLAPADPLIAHSRARVALEAGLPAVDLFEAAARLAPADGSVVLGRVAARIAAGEGARAEAELAGLLRVNPLWVDGHADLVQLRCILGDRQGCLASIEAALGQAPDAPALWQLLIQKLIEADDFAAIPDVATKGRERLGEQPFFLAAEAIAYSETGSTGLADACFEKLDHVSDMSLAVRKVRHQLRTDRTDRALKEIDKWTGDPAANPIWPYAAIAWRLAGDPRLEWLEGDPALVSVTDITRNLPPLGDLAAVLRRLHQARAEQLDQSVRGGTQTDGVLLQRIEPEIRALRAAIAGAVREHVRRLPAIDPAHPVLRNRRDRPVRFAGSWSVRLRDGGYHANHVHPAGWFSSALYIALPESISHGEDHSGWLTLGEPQAELGLHVQPLRLVEPKPGRLVIFPSIMWHGTLPFPKGERLTVAVDISP